MRIMPLGDSITAEPGGWRGPLLRGLRSAGRDVEFVGSQRDEDGGHEGHSGMFAVDLAAGPLLPGWLASARPEVVLVHLGTNDIWHRAEPVPSILAAFDALVGRMRGLRVLVARIIPIDRPGGPELVEELNAALPGWAEGRPGVEVVDQWSGFCAETDTEDGVHPNAAGNRKIADRWLSALL